MTARARLAIAYASEDAARAVALALAPENEGFVRARVEGATLAVEAEAEGTGALLHTLDDFLACLSAAEKAIGVARG